MKKISQQKVVIDPDELEDMPRLTHTKSVTNNKPGVVTPKNPDELEDMPRAMIGPPKQIAQQNTYNSSFSAIKEMQQAIINFSNIANSNDITSPSIKKQEDTNSFEDFLVGQYVNQPNKEENKNINFKKMIDDLKKIGSPGKNNEPDGIWMGKTDASLKSIYAIGYAIMNFSNDIGETLSTDVAGALKNFKIPSSYTKIPVNEKENMAKDFTQDINLLAKAFSDFKEKILNNKKYTPFINQKKAFFKIPKTNQQTAQSLTSEQEQIVKNKGNSALGTTQLLQYTTLADLYDLDSFKNFMKKINKDSNDPKEITAVLDRLSNDLSNNQVIDPGF